MSIMDFQNPFPLQQVPAPTTIYIVHRTQWYKYFFYRKWRCDEKVDLMGAHATLEGAYAAVAIDFKCKAELNCSRWLLELWKDQNETTFDEWPLEKQFKYINQFMTERKQENNAVDVGWTYLVSSTTLSYFNKKRKSFEMMAGDERVTMKPKITADEKLQLVVKKEDDDSFKFNKENNCPSCLQSLRPKTDSEEAIQENSGSAPERRSLGYYSQG